VVHVPHGTCGVFFLLFEDFLLAIEYPFLIYYKYSAGKLNRFVATKAAGQVSFARVLLPGKADLSLHLIVLTNQVAVLSCT
jgi:hypothetical protein